MGLARRALQIVKAEKCDEEDGRSRVSLEQPICKYRCRGFKVEALWERFGRHYQS